MEENFSLEEWAASVRDAMADKLSRHHAEVFESKSYQDEIKYLKKITLHFAETLRSISIYSTRARHIYDNFLTIHVIDELNESALGILTLVENGIHNIPKRELRYLIELITKYVIIDYEKMGAGLEDKLDHLRNGIPNSSIEVIDRYSTPFPPPEQQQFRDEVKDFFYKACAYVHPSRKQLDEQLKNRQNGNTIGFESTAMLTAVNKLIFRAYDMILVMIFHGFGPSMSKDVFEVLLDEDKKWAFHKGKYVRAFRKQLN
ncbi:hypothetical protein [Mucilaginibacter pedocola]|uniref:Uncharacterized protein n=1 Tax=Mucilaginibacter pedocola TaxID=1792845 RepID=A0A1S9PBG6_9SPHI|nr:hypothetical protein [Mucilaginibacter pedocola]OOQ58295.1 hypothetical protein BC343_11720 [Mucilaginibacter pedocola]